MAGARRGHLKTPYPKMAPVDQYMMERSAEIAMALSAAPPSISKDAEVMVMGPHGYEVAVKGKNGFVCMVERGWIAGLDDPVFLEPEDTGCRSASTRPPRDSTSQSRSKKTALVLAGRCQGADGRRHWGRLRQEGVPAARIKARCVTCCRSRDT